MKKYFQKVGQIFLCLLLMITIQQVKAASYNLYINEAYRDLFNFPSSYNLVSGEARVQYLSVEGNGEYMYAWCVAPNVATKPGSSYLPTDPNNVANKRVQNIIMEANLHYNLEQMWEYYAVQVAVWGSLVNEDPINLQAASWIESQELLDIVNDIRTLASRFYRNRDIDRTPVIDVTLNGNKINTLIKDGSISTDIGRIDTESIYLIEGEPYFKIPTINFYKNIGIKNVDIKFKLNITDELVYDGNGTYISKDSSGYYPFAVNGLTTQIFVPAYNNTADSERTATITYSVNADYLEPLGWDGSANNSQNMLSVEFNNYNSILNANFAWRSAKRPDVVENTADLTLIKIGQQPDSYTTENVDGENWYKIAYDLGVLAGADFVVGIEDSEGNPKTLNYLLTTQSNGNAFIKNVKLENIRDDGSGNNVAVMFLHEYKAPTGYYLDDSEPDRIVVLKEDPSTHKYKPDYTNITTVNNVTFENERKVLTVDIVKNDDYGNLVEGVAFGLYSTEAIKLLDGTTIPAGSLVDYGKTSSEGKLTLGSSLPVNQNYIIREISTDANHYNEISKITIDNVDVTESLVNNGYEIDLSDFINGNDATKKLNIEVTNNKIEKFDLEINKVDALTNNPLANVEFTISSLDGNDYNNTVKTNTNGKIVLTDLDKGLYNIQETSALSAYVENALVSDVISLNTDLTGSKALTYKNYPNPTLKITKYGVEDDVKSPLSGVKFEITDSEGNVQTVITDSNGEATLSINKFDTYKVKEVEGKTGYIVDNTEKTVIFSKEEIDTDVINLNKEIEFTNYKKPTLTITKVDEDDNTVNLSGAVFEIRDKNDILVDTATTGADGKATVVLDGYGTFTVSEKTAPENYIKQTNTWMASFEKDVNSSVSLNITNKKKPELTISKVLVEINSNGEIIETAGANVEFDVVDSADTTIAHLTTNENGKASVLLDNIEKYTIIETSTPNGYIKSENVDVNVVTDTEVKIVNYKTPTLTIIKNGENENGITRLQNVEFEVADLTTNTKQSYFTDSNGEIKINLTHFGSYRIEEKDAPAEYIKDNTLKTVVFSETEPTNKTVTFTNTAKPILSIFKVDKETNAVLAGAKFEILKDGVVVKTTGETAADGQTTVTLDDYGKYQIREIEAPLGYLLNSNIIDVTVDDFIEYVEISNEAIIPGSLVANIKLSKTYTNEVEGTSHFAKFEIESGAETKNALISGTKIDGLNTTFEIEVADTGNHLYKVRETDGDSFASLDKNYYTIEFNTTKNSTLTEIVLDGIITVKKYRQDDTLISTETFNNFEEIDLNFVNNYSSTGEVKLELSKTGLLSGENRDFAFIVDCSNLTQQQVIVKASENYRKTVNLPTNDGLCTISEIQTGSYDYPEYQNLNNKEIKVEYTIADNGQGELYINSLKINDQLTTATSSTISVEFQNRKMLTENVGFIIEKDIENLDSLSGQKAFTFDIYDYNIANGNKKLLGSKVVTVNSSMEGEATYQLAVNSIGEKYLYITENSDANYNTAEDRIVKLEIGRNATKDKFAITKFSVYDKNMNLISETSDNNYYRVSFTNTYITKPVETSFRIEKIVNSPVNNPTFKFEVTADDSSVIVENIEGIKMTSKDQLSSPIGLTFTQTGVYDVKVKETKLTGTDYKYWTFDTTTYTLRYKISKDNDLYIESLEVYKNDSKTLTYSRNFDKVSLTFRNSYLDTSPVSISIPVKKTVTYSDDKPSARERFMFKISETDEIFSLKEGDSIIYKTNLKFGQGTYTLELKEVKDNSLKYYSFDDSTYLVKVNVYPDPSADYTKLKSEVTIMKDGKAVSIAEFINKYSHKTPSVPSKPSSQKPVTNTSSN